MKRLSLLAIFAAALMSIVLTAPASAANLQAIPLPAPGGASDLIVGPDGALWFASTSRDEIDRYDIATGSLSRFPIIHREDEGENEGPSKLTAGADGKVWYLTDDGREIGRISSAGVAEPVFYTESDVFFGDISAAPGGGAWESVQSDFTGDIEHEVRLLSEAGTTTKFPYEGEFSSGGPISTAPDGSAWIGDWGARISSVAPTGAIASYPTAIGSTEEINSIAFGPDGSVWYAGFSPEIFVAGESGVAGSSAYGGSIGHLSPGGAPQGFKIGSNTLTGSITGGGGAMWFAVAGGVGRIEASGAYQLGPTQGYQPGTRTDPSNLVYGPDGALWFIDNEKSALVRVAIDGALFPPPPAPPAPTPTPAPKPKPTPTPGPKMSLLVKSQRVRLVEKQKGIALTCALQGTGKCSLQLTITAKDAQKLHLKVPKKEKTLTIGKTSRTFKKASALTLVVKLPAKVLQALRHLHKPLSVTVTATTTSSGHSPRQLTKKISIRP
jgi:streptogramin lyase